MGYLLLVTFDKNNDNNKNDPSNKYDKNNDKNDKNGHITISKEYKQYK